MMSGNPAERRVFPRKPFRTAVVFEDEYGDGLFYVYSENISLNGLYLASSVPLRLGTLLFLSFTLPGFKRPARVTGEVVRVVRPEDEGEGVGIRFVGLDEKTINRLEDFLQTDAD
jgi:uncharacterized protein (TIGR02266 family)